MKKIPTKILNGKLSGIKNENPKWINAARVHNRTPVRPTNFICNGDPNSIIIMYNDIRGLSGC